MTFRQFTSIFDEILRQDPLPNGDIWKLQRLTNAELQAENGWMEVLYRTRATYQCNHGHLWNSSWTMIVFRFHSDHRRSFRKVGMKRFGQRCKECRNDNTYHVGFCPLQEVWRMVQCLLLNILQRCYERRPEVDVDDLYYIIPVTNVPNGGFGGGVHQEQRCEACAHDRCQKKFREITKKK